MPLCATRAELDIALNLLRAEMPAMVEQFRVDGEFWIAFRAHSDVLIADASPVDLNYVSQQLDAILALHDRAPLSEPPT